MHQPLNIVQDSEHSYCSSLCAADIPLEHAGEALEHRVAAFEALAEMLTLGDLPRGSTKLCERRAYPVIIIAD